MSVESEGGYLASISCQSSVDASASPDAAERRSRLMRLPPFNSSIAPSPTDEVEQVMEELQTSSAVNISETRSYSHPHRRAFRRKTRMPRPYTNALTLHVPSGEMISDKEDEVENDAKPRRASFDDRLMSDYRHLHSSSCRSSK